MKVAFFAEPGKQLPRALRVGALRGTRYAKVSLTLLQSPDGTFEITGASRSVIKPEELERLKAAVLAAEQ